MNNACSINQLYKCIIVIYIQPLIIICLLLALTYAILSFGWCSWMLPRIPLQDPRQKPRNMLQHNFNPDTTCFRSTGQGHDRSTAEGLPWASDAFWQRSKCCFFVEVLEDVLRGEVALIKTKQGNELPLQPYSHSSCRLDTYQFQTKLMATCHFLLEQLTQLTWFVTR